MLLHDLLLKLPECHTLEITKYEKYEGTTVLKLTSWGGTKETIIKVKLSQNLIVREAELLKEAGNVDLQVSKTIDHLIKEVEHMDKYRIDN